MFRFAANLTYLFQDHPFLDRFALAADAGFMGVEFHYPHEHRWNDVYTAAKSAAVRIVQSSIPSGDRRLGKWGVAALPEQRDTFRDSMRKALEFAAVAQVPRLHAPSGVVRADIPWDHAWGTYTENIAWAAEAASTAGVRLLIEPINERDTPCYFLSRPSLARRVLRAVGSPNLFIQID